jgi:hypothetical protein
VLTDPRLVSGIFPHIASVGLALSEKQMPRLLETLIVGNIRCRA